MTESAGGALSEQVTMLEDTTKPHIPAVFISDFPKIDLVKDIEFTMIFAASKAGRAYYIVVPKGASAPSSEQVKSGSGYVAAEIVAHGSQDVPASSAAIKTVTGLTAEMEYDVYAVMEDAATGSLQQEPTKLQVTMLPDQAPDYHYSYPRMLLVTEDALRFMVFMRKQGNVYYMVTEDDATPPTPQEVKAGSAYRDVVPVKTGSSPNVGTTFTFTVYGLAEDSKYKVYIVTESVAGTLSEQPAVLEATTPHAVPAQFVSGNPSTSQEQEDQFKLALNLTRAGTVHYMVVPKDSEAPTAEEVKAGTHYRGITPVAGGSLSANPNADVLVTGLSPDTEYDIYAVIEDTRFGLPPPPAKISAQTTPDAVDYWDFPHVHDISDGGFKLQMGIRKPGYGYYLIQPAGEAAPTAQQVKQNPTGMLDLTHESGGRWAQIHGLTPETAYDIYVVAETIYGTLQEEPIKLVVTTLKETDPPAFILGTPYISHIGSEHIQFAYKLNKLGTVHYIVVSPEAPQPTPDQVVMGVSYDGVSIIQSKQMNFIPDASIPFETITGLEPENTYVIYFVAKGAGGNMTLVVRIEATTLE